MRLVTRADLDGLTASVLISEMEEIDEILLVHPQDITDKKVDVYFNPELDTEELTALFSNSIVSREYVTEYLGIVDEGSTYMPMQQSFGNSPFGSGDGNEDEPSNKRKTKPDKTVRGTGSGG